MHSSQKRLMCFARLLAPDTAHYCMMNVAVGVAFFLFVSRMPVLYIILRNYHFWGIFFFLSVFVRCSITTVSNIDDNLDQLFHHNLHLLHSTFGYTVSYWISLNLYAAFHFYSWHLQSAHCQKRLEANSGQAVLKQTLFTVNMHARAFSQLCPKTAGWQLLWRQLCSAPRGSSQHRMSYLLTPHPPVTPRVIQQLCSSRPLRRAQYQWLLSCTAHKLETATVRPLNCWRRNIQRASATTRYTHMHKQQCRLEHVACRPFVVLSRVPWLYCSFSSRGVDDVTDDERAIQTLHTGSSYHRNWNIGRIPARVTAFGNTILISPAGASSIHVWQFPSWKGCPSRRLAVIKAVAVHLSCVASGVVLADVGTKYQQTAGNSLKLL